ncbi:nucleotidyltransferase substrate binding protein [Clostridium sp. CF012]|nr:nucleotidyltransferase substrate binding protein [Clostridium sp. CF012]MBU3146068.1 nucleotidyltransferase substrate binding protein [Clostridium sp. CF012]
MRNLDFKYMNLKKAYENNIISDELVWINLLEDRTSTSHIYNES